MEYILTQVRVHSTMNNIKFPLWRFWVLSELAVNNAVSSHFTVQEQEEVSMLVWGNFPLRRTYNNDAVSHAAEAAVIYTSLMHRRCDALHLRASATWISRASRVRPYHIVSQGALTARNRGLIFGPNPRGSGNLLIILTFITRRLKDFPMRSTRAEKRRKTE